MRTLEAAQRPTLARRAGEARHTRLVEHLDLLAADASDPRVRTSDRQPRRAQAHEPFGLRGGQRDRLALLVGPGEQHIAEVGLVRQPGLDSKRRGPSWRVLVPGPILSYAATVRRDVSRRL